MQGIDKNRTQVGRSGRKLAGALVAVLFGLAQIQGAAAAIVNTITATGDYQGTPVSASNTLNITVAPAAPAITLAKTGVLNDGGDGQANVGDTITYSFTVTNSGNITLTNVSVTDPKVTVAGGPIASLAPGAVDATTFTAVYTLTQADVNAGSLVNTASAGATAASGGTVTANASATTPLVGAGALALTKSGTLNDGGDGIADVGDTITYSFHVTNTGPVTLTNVSVSDPKLDFAYYQAHGSQLALAAGPDLMATGSITPAAQTLAAPMPLMAAARPDVAALTTDRVMPVVTVPDTPAGLAVERTAYLPAEGQIVEGLPITVVYAVTNTGDMPLTNVRMWSPDGSQTVPLRAVLAPGETDNVTFALNHALNAQEAETGLVPDRAVVSATARGKRVLAGLMAPVDVASLMSADNLLTASITPTTVATLAPGASTDFTATYTLTQADLDAGLVDNSATAHGTDPANNVLTANATAQVPLPAMPGIALVKTATLDLGADATASLGDIITYHFAVTNTGNVTLTNVTVTDPSATVSGGPLAKLAPSQTDATTFTATHALTQADLDAGKVQNQATASGTDPNGKAASDLSDDASETENDPTITPLTAKAAIALIKTSGAITDTNGNGINDAGDTLAYAFTVTNTGNVTLTNVTVTDPKVTVSGGPLASLAPGISDTTTFTASYVLTQADFDAGSVTNQATASGTGPDSTVVTDDSDDGDPTQNDPTVTPLNEAPAIALVKTVASFTDSNNNGLHDTGDIINYAFAVTNTGNVTLSNITVTDPLGTVSGGPLATLLAGQTDTTTFTMAYTITANDMLTGKVTNQAIASGTSPKGTSVTDKSDDAAVDQDDATVTPLDESPAIALIKTATGVADTNSNGVTDAGDTITYAFTVTNTGNVTLTNVSVTDPLVSVNGGPLGSLAVGQSDSTTFTATYILTAADVTAGKVTNQATASGTSTGGTVVSDLSDDAVNNEDDPTVTPLVAAPAIALVKTVASITDTNGNHITDAGDVIHYAFAVTNTGNVDLTNVTITDPMVTVNGGPLASLGVGLTDTSKFSADYTITQDDVNAGQVVNQAVVKGVAPDKTEPTDRSDNNATNEDDPTVTPLKAKPGIAIVKSVSKVEDVNGDGLTNAGDIIHYTFKVTNTGNVSLTNVSVTDPLVSVSGGPLAKLDPGVTDSKTFTAAYTITPADEGTGKVVNQAVANGKAPDGSIITDDSDDKNINGNHPTITPIAKSKPILTKTALTDQIRRGEQASFEIVARRVMFKPARLDDIMPPGFTYVKGSATVNGKPVTPVVNGRRLTFAGLTPDSAGTLRLKLRLLATAAIVPGTLVNNAELYNGNNPVVVAKANAPILIIEDAVFDCGEIIGKVFDDKNQNGYQDDGEPGMPAVRLATVNGLLITTDSNGRYHIPCAALPDAEIGSNFVLKLDTRTLPTGYSLTTENPRDVRLTRGKIVKLNFGVAIHRIVKLQLKDGAFVAGSTNLRPEWAAQLPKLYAQLDVAPSILRLTYAVGADGKDLAKARLAAVKALVSKGWKQRKHTNDLTIDSKLGTEQ